MPNLSVPRRRRGRLLIAVALAVSIVAALFTSGPLSARAEAAVCATLAHGDTGEIVTHISCYDSTVGAPTGNGTSRYAEFRWTPVCMGTPPPDLEPDPNRLCTLQISTCHIDEKWQELWAAVDLAAGRRWLSLGKYCRSSDLDVSDSVSDQMVLDALRRTGLPRLRVRTEPTATTLVNLPTVLSTVADPFRTEFRLLGQRVEVIATATAFEWSHGDHTTQRTTRPGKPYPSREVTHTYSRTSAEVELSVTVSWTARVRLNGGQWHTIAEPLRTEGPVTRLRVAEATPVLSAVR